MAFFPDLLDLEDVGIKKIRALSLPDAFFDNNQFSGNSDDFGGMTDDNEKKLSGERGVSKIKWVGEFCHIDRSGPLKTATS